MERLAERYLDIIIELSDNEGYIQKELIDKTGITKTNISPMLDDLSKDGIVYDETDKIKKKARGLRGHGSFYYIGPKGTASCEEKLDVFQLILESSMEVPKSDLQEKLLASKYVDSLIATCGLDSLYEILEVHMEQQKFRIIASQTLLNQPALIEEYIKLPLLMKESVESDKNRMKDFVFYSRSNNKYLEFLFKLYNRDSIKFYRKYLAKPFGKLYRNLTDKVDMKNANQYVTEEVKKFLELDIFLSPATSFPRNHPFSILFARPFERLYNDIYICDDSDYEIMVQRAYQVYSHFTEILRLGIKSVRGEEDYHEKITKFLAKSNEDYLAKIEFDFMRSRWRDLFYKKQNIINLVKELIFYWNIASLRLDLIYRRRGFFRWEGSKGGYHFLTNSNGILAIDITENRSQPGTVMTSEDMIITSLWSGDSDPFSNLRYCYCFKDLNLEEIEISVEEIASAIEDIGFG